MSEYSEDKCVILKRIGDDINNIMCKLSEEDQAEAIMDEMISQSDGHYSPYPLPPTLRLLENHKFCYLTDFLDFINLYENRILHVECNNVREKFTKLQRKAPFDFLNRFPDLFYVHMDSTKIKTATEEFMDALNHLDLLRKTYCAELHFEETSLPSYYKVGHMISVAKATNSCIAVLRKLSTICKSTDIEYLKENSVFCRESFEKHYGLTWVSTPRY